jgi:endonuclease
VYSGNVRVIVADCSAEYSGRLNASLPPAKRVLMVKADNSFLIFSELGSYKPLNWMAAPCIIREVTSKVTDGSADPAADVSARTTDDESSAAAELAEVSGMKGTLSVFESSETSPSPTTSTLAISADSGHNGQEAEAAAPVKVFRISSQKTTDILEVKIYHVYADDTYDLGVDPGLNKDGVEDHLQRYLAEQIDRIGEGAKLVRREYPTAIEPVDIMAVDAEGWHVAIEIKRNGGIDGVEQLTRYVNLLNKDPLLAPVRGLFAAQTITPQARTLATERGFECLILDYEEMKGVQDDSLRLF